jgi:hypothetical protein
VSRSAVHRLQATLAADLNPPVDRSSGQDKASARAVPRSTPNFKAAHPSIAMPPRRNPSWQRSKVLPKARQVSMLPPAAHQLQATPAADLHTPADRRTAPRQGKCSCCPSQHINFQAQDPSGAMLTAATHCIAQRERQVCEVGFRLVRIRSAAPTGRSGKASAAGNIIPVRREGCSGVQLVQAEQSLL